MLGGGTVVFCRREMREFPDDEFYYDERWGLLHNVNPVHTSLGTPRDDGGGGGGPSPSVGPTPFADLGDINV